MNLGIGRTLAAVLLGVSLLATHAAAQSPTFGAPTLTLMQARPTSIKLAVHAGDGGAPVGFTVQWMKKSDYDVLGWPADVDAALKSSDFTGTPTWIVQGNAGDFTLAQGQWQAVALGELFDESGVGSNSVAELEPNTEYVVRAYVLCDTNYPISPYSETLFVTTGAQSTNCTFTIGYWKNHTAAWPVTSLTLGSVNYTAAEILSILNEPAGGNGLIILAHQLIGTKLNVANGADPTAVASDIANADAMIGALVVPPVGSDALSPGSVNSLASTLDDYNNGLIGPGHCAETPAHQTTWGLVKSNYRR